MTTLEIKTAIQYLNLTESLFLLITEFYIISSLIDDVIAYVS